MTPNTVIIKLSPYSTRYVVIAVSECSERWEVRSLWRSLGKAESPVCGWWKIRQWNHHTNIQRGSGKKKKSYFLFENIFSLFNLMEHFLVFLYKQRVRNG